MVWGGCGAILEHSSDISSVTVHVFTFPVYIRDGGHETPPLHEQLPVRALQMLLSWTVMLGVGGGGV